MAQIAIPQDTTIIESTTGQLTPQWQQTLTMMVRTINTLQTQLTAAQSTINTMQSQISALQSGSGH